MTTTKTALLVLTSHTELGNTGRGTGFYYDEMAAPYWALTDLGFDVTLASVAGGEGQPDPKTWSRPMPDHRWSLDSWMTKPRWRS